MGRKESDKRFFLVLGLVFVAAILIDGRITQDEITGHQIAENIVEENSCTILFKTVESSSVCKGNVAVWCVKYEGLSTSRIVSIGVDPRVPPVCPEGYVKVGQREVRNQEDACLIAEASVQHIEQENVCEPRLTCKTVDNRKYAKGGDCCSYVNDRACVEIDTLQRVQRPREL